MTTTYSPLACQALNDPDMNQIVFRIREFIRGRNVGEVIAFAEDGKPLSARLHISPPRPAEAEAAYLLRGAAAQDTVAEAVAGRHLWRTMLDDTLDED